MAGKAAGEVYVNIWSDSDERELSKADRRLLREQGASGHVVISDFPPGHLGLKATAHHVWVDQVEEPKMGQALEAEREACRSAAEAYQARMAARQ